MSVVEQDKLSLTEFQDSSPRVVESRLVESFTGLKSNGDPSVQRQMQETAEELVVYLLGRRDVNIDVVKEAVYKGIVKCVLERNASFGRYLTERALKLEQEFPTSDIDTTVIRAREQMADLIPTFERQLRGRTNDQTKDFIAGIKQLLQRSLLSAAGEVA